MGKILTLPLVVNRSYPSLDAFDQIRVFEGHYDLHEGTKFFTVQRLLTSASSFLLQAPALKILLQNPILGVASKLIYTMHLWTSARMVVQMSSGLTVQAFLLPQMKNKRSTK